MSPSSYRPRKHCHRSGFWEGCGAPAQGTICWEIGGIEDEGVGDRGGDERIRVNGRLKMLRMNSLKGMTFDSMGSSRQDSVRGPNSAAPPPNDEPFVNGAGVSFVRTRLILSFCEAHTKAVDELLSDDTVIDELSKFFSADGPKRLLFFHQARMPALSHAPSWA